MFDPRVEGYSHLNDTELHDKITTVLQRMNYFQQLGKTSSYSQLNNIYWMLLEEQQARLIKNKTEETDQFDDLIKVKK